MKASQSKLWCIGVFPRICPYYKNLVCNLALLLMLGASPSIVAQNITFFFSAGDLGGEADRFGNTYTVGPQDAIDPRPFGNEDLQDVFFDEDDKWLIYKVEGNTMLVSHSPGGFEDSPELFMDITTAIGGKYEVILNFLDSRNTTGAAPIKAALGGGELVEYSELNATPATGGTSPGYPQFDGNTQGTMWWQTVSLGEVEVEDGGVIKVRVDDSDDVFSDEWITSTWQGVTLRVIELGGAISEIQVSPGAFDWVTDVSGNQFKTGPQDSALSEEEWITINANSASDQLWNIREGLGSYGPIIESFPKSGEDAPALQTSVKFAVGGTYDVFFSLGDIGPVDEEENLTNPTPLNFGKEGEEMIRWHANDGEFKGTPGYNDYEMHVGVIEVTDGEQVNFLVDDVQDGTAIRSVYLGMRFVKQANIAITEFNVSPGVFEPTTDLFGNTIVTGPQDSETYPAQEDWITINANNGDDGLWNIREGLGSYGPILESFPNSGDDAPRLQTTVTFGTAGTYEVYLSLGDTGAVNEEENLATPTPLNFAFEGEELTRWHANDGEFIGTPGYNDYEMSVGQITVAKGEARNFLIDDVQDGTATRSVYLGMRFVFVEGGVEPEPSPTLLMISTQESADGAPAHVFLSWESIDGATYTVEASSNLIDWTTVAENLVSEGETTTYSEETSQSVRFFRLRSL
ncbi:hypothetical protein N8667_01435 [Verrucomicrobia bacterium]|nr:hypothetical protein [Verrucomicrobiota bacterium]